MAVDVLKSRGVPEDHILFLNLIASPEGVNKFAERFPELRVVTAFVDQGLDEKKYSQLKRIASSLLTFCLVIYSQDWETLVIDTILCNSLSDMTMLESSSPGSRP